jgi:NodT family efflux transporter outer membrane factor (OMF) lipoprotein
MKRRTASSPARPPIRPRPRIAGLLALFLLSGCVVGPNYRRPSAPMTARFKEAAGWTPSRPMDSAPKGDWWSVFNDPDLDALEQRVAVSNQTVKEDEAAYREAHAIVAEARASFLPTLSAAASAVSAKGAQGTTAPSSVSAARYSVLSPVLEASWAPDLWGRIRRTVESDKDLAQAAAADVANARLSAQASLAEDYFDLRVLDEEIGLYQKTVTAYQKFLTLTQDQVREGTQPQSAALAAQSQLLTAQSSLTALAVSRAQMEHAVAILTGVGPADLTIPTKTLTRDAPMPGAPIPSTLLERRPDIAGAERRMASGNALIGVAVSASYPSLTLSAEYGFSGSSLASLFSASNSLWSLGADASETLVDFGARRAAVAAARAAYDEDVAVYRQTVLDALQGVEDELVAMRVYARQQAFAVQAETVARQTVQLEVDAFQAGTVDSTTVIAAQASLLAASLSVLSVLEHRLQASVLLIENLGGGWSWAALPKS